MPLVSLKSLDELHDEHRKLRKELQTRVQTLKKTVTKGDKKKKKEVDAEIAKLEADFEAKCQLEIDNWETTKSIKEITTAEKRVGENVVAEADNLSQGSKKPSKAQKKREKKDLEDKERQKQIELQEIENKKGPQHLELQAIKAKLKAKGLVLNEVRADGNCMYYAVADQCSRAANKSYSTEKLRELVSEHMMTHVDDFMPYLDELYEQESPEKAYKHYCAKVRDATVWGGHLELKALSDVLNMAIEVVQAEGAEIMIGESFAPNAKLVLTFHRHFLGSGEHYNSTKRDEEENDEKNKDE